MGLNKYIVDDKAQISSAQYEALIQLLKTSGVIWEGSRVFFSRWNLSPSQFNILNLLLDFPKGCTQTELGRQLIMHRSNVTGMVDRLEARGLVLRKSDPSDRRVHHVQLTPAARRLLGAILPEYHLAAKTLWRGVDSGRTRAIVSDLKRLAQNVESVISLDGAPETKPAGKPDCKPDKFSTMDKRR